MYVIHLADKMSRFEETVHSYTNSKEEADSFCKSKNDKYKWEYYYYTKIKALSEKN